MSKKWKLVGAVASAAGCLVLAPAATAAPSKTVIYGGKAEFGGRVAMDVKLSKDGTTAKTITELRAVGLPGTCEISGPNIPLNATLPVKISVAKDGKFHFVYTDQDGKTSTLDGKFTGRDDRDVKGSFVYSSHFAAEGPYPEEDCATPPTDFTERKGGKNVVEPAPAP